MSSERTMLVCKYCLAFKNVRRFIPPPELFWLKLLLTIIVLVACTKQPSPGAAALDRLASVTDLSEETCVGQIRQPEGVDYIYPAESGELKPMIDGFLAKAQSVGGVPVALVVPHASYAISGQIAACGFRQLSGHNYEVAIIIANDHHEPLAMPIAVWTEGAWQTPLGIVPVDTQLARALVEADPRITANETVFVGEHPIEAEIPFLQRTCPQCEIVPVIMGNNYPADVDALANALIRLLPDYRAVIIASSDLSHFPNYSDAQQVDKATLDAIVSFDPDTLRATVIRQTTQGIPNLSTCACGEGAILVTMQVAKALGASAATTLCYSNSGDHSEARKDHVTGFGVVMFWKD